MQGLSPIQGSPHSFILLRVPGWQRGLLGTKGTQGSTLLLQKNNPLGWPKNHVPQNPHLGMEKIREEFSNTI